MKIKSYNWNGILLLCFPAFNTYAMQQIPVLKDIINIWGMISFVAIICILLFKKKRLKNGVEYIVYFCILYLLSTVLNYKDQLIGAVSECIRLLIVPLYLTTIELHRPKMVFRVIDKLSKIVSLLLVIDCIAVYYQVFFSTNYVGASYSLFGLDNYAAFSILPFLGIVLFNSWHKNGIISRTSWALFLFCFSAKCITKCTTAIIAMVLMVFIILLIQYLPVLKRIFSIRFIIAIIILFVVGVSLFSIQNHLTPILQLLGKDATISFRSVMWPRVVKAIINKPLLGYGKTDGIIFRDITGFSVLYDLSASHPHNYFLSLVFTCGLAGTLIYAMLVRKVIQSFRRTLSNNKSMISLLSCTISFFVLGLADDYIMQPAFYMMVSIILVIGSLHRGKRIESRIGI